MRLTAVTDTQGAYGFANLRPGTYTIADDIPPGYTNGKNVLGTLGGTLGPSRVDNIVVHAGASGADYNFGKLMRYDINPAVAYTVVLKKPNGTPVPVDATGKYRLSQGDSFTIEVYATDVRRGVGASGGVASAHAKLLYEHDFMDFLPGSLKIAPAFDLATSGSVNEPFRRIYDAGGSFDLAANGQTTPGARTPQLLFSVGGQVPETVPNTSLAVLRLLPAGRHQPEDDGVRHGPAGYRRLPGADPAGRFALAKPPQPVGRQPGRGSQRPGRIGSAWLPWRPADRGSSRTAAPARAPLWMSAAMEC